MAAPSPIQLSTSKLKVIEVRGKDEFLARADDLDPLYVRLYGADYPHRARDEFASLGPRSRAAAVYHEGLLVAFMAYVHDAVHQRVEVGRMLRHPDYTFDMIVVGEQTNRFLMELTADSDMLLHGTTRIWVTSYYMELSGLRMCGSLVLPAWNSSPWGGGRLVNPLLGVWVSISPQRAARSAALPEWVARFFPEWSPVFARYACAAEPVDLGLEPEVIPFPPEPGTEGSGHGELVWVPCVSSERVARTVEELVHKGHVLMAFLPGWRRIEGNGGVVHVSYLVLEHCDDGYECCPARFALSTAHFKFTRRFHGTSDGVHRFYRRPLSELFRQRQLPLTRRVLLRLYSHFHQIRVYNLLDGEQATEAVAARLFPPG